MTVEREHAKPLEAAVREWSRRSDVVSNEEDL